MSMQAINFALTLPIDESGPRLTLIIIAHHINYRSGDMFVGQDELAKEVKRDERTIRRYLTYLEERGFIHRHPQRTTDGKRTTDRIELVGYLEWQNVLEKGGVIPAPESRGKPVQKQADNLSGSTPTTGQNTPAQPDKNMPASGHMVSGTKRTTNNQYNHYIAHTAEQDPAREAFAPNKAEQVLNLFSKVKVGARALPSSKLTDLDRLKVQAEKFALDVDDLAEKTANRNAKNPAGYFLTLAVNQLRSKTPLLGEKVLAAAMRGESLAVSAVFQALSEPVR